LEANRNCYSTKPWGTVSVHGTTAHNSGNPAAATVRAVNSEYKRITTKHVLTQFSPTEKEI
jgi:hypothetical protein